MVQAAKQPLMNADAYKDGPERYDLSFGRFGEYEPQVVEFFRRFFAQNNVYAVLDCACGTGRHLLLFHNLWKRVNASEAIEIGLDFFLVTWYDFSSYYSNH